MFHSRLSPRPSKPLRASAAPCHPSYWCASTAPCLCLRCRFCLDVPFAHLAKAVQAVARLCGALPPILLVRLNSALPLLALSLLFRCSIRASRQGRPSRCAPLRRPATHPIGAPQQRLAFACAVASV